MKFLKNVEYGCVVGKKWLRFSFRFRFAKNCIFSVRFRFYKINCSFCFSVQFFALCVVYCVCTLLSAFQFTVLSLFCMTLEMTYFRGELVQLTWPKWLRTRSVEIRHEEKYSDCWSYHVGRWIVNGTMWKNRRSRFLKTKLLKLNFRFLNFEVSSVRFLENWCPTFSSGSTHP